MSHGVPDASAKRRQPAAPPQHHIKLSAPRVDRISSHVDASGRQLRVPSYGADIKSTLQNLVQKRNQGPAQPRQTADSSGNLHYVPITIQHGFLATHMRELTPSRHAVHGVAFSPDGQLLVRYGVKAAVQVLRSRNGTLFCPLRGPDDECDSLYAAFSADGEHIITAHDNGRIQVYSVEYDLHGAPHKVSGLVDMDVASVDPRIACALSLDNTSVLFSQEGGKLHRWTIAEPWAKVEYNPQGWGRGDVVMLASFARQGSAVVCCGNNWEMVLLDAETQAVITRASFSVLRQGRQPTPSYVISPDGRWVVVYTSETTPSLNSALYDTNTSLGTSGVKLLKLSDASLSSVVFSPDSSMLLVVDLRQALHVHKFCGDDGLILCATLVGGHHHPIQACCIRSICMSDMSQSGPPSNLGLGQAKSSLQQSDGNGQDQQAGVSGKEPPRQRSGDGTGGKRRTLALSADSDGQVVVWDVDAKKPMVRLHSAHVPIVRVELSADGRRALTLDSDGGSYLWYLDMHGLFTAMHEEVTELSCCALAADGCRLVIGSADGTLGLWQLDSSSLQYSAQPSHCPKAWKHKEHGAPIECVAICEHATWTAVGGVVASSSCNGVILLTGLRDGLPVSKIQERHEDGEAALAFNYNGTLLLSSARSSSAYLWNVGVRRAASPGPPGGLGEAEGGLYETPTLWRQLHVPGDAANITACAMGPAGQASQSIAVCGNAAGSVLAWSLGSKPDSEPRLIQSHSVSPGSAIMVINFTISDRRILQLVGSANGCITVLELAAEWRHEPVSLLGSASCVTGIYCIQPPPPSTHGPTIIAAGHRRAVTWKLPASPIPAEEVKAVHAAHFIAGESSMYNCNSVAQEKSNTFVAHIGLTIYDPTLHVTMSDLCPLGREAGDSCLFSKSTVLLQGGIHRKPLVLYAPADSTMTLLDDTGSYTCLDFSPCGNHVVTGNTRGELSVWDMVYGSAIESGKQQGDLDRRGSWLAHRRSRVACVLFSADGSKVYSGGGDDDTRIMVWNWQLRMPLAKLEAHQSAIVGMAITNRCSGNPAAAAAVAKAGRTLTDHLASVDSEGMLIIWDTAGPYKPAYPRHDVVDAHLGAALSCSISADGSNVLTSGEDRKVQLMRFHSDGTMTRFNLGDLLDGKVRTVRFSADGKRALIGGARGQLLVWDVAEGCLLHCIRAQDDGGSVLDCCWSGDGRKLLSVGEDGKARLWDAEGGGELCQADVEQRLEFPCGGGFVKCALSPDGSIMAGCTVKGYLIRWDVGRELEKQPNAQMLIKWLSAMPNEEAREQYARLLNDHPKLYNAQDSQGWTLLMHAAEAASVEVVSMIIAAIPPGEGTLGLVSSTAHSIWSMVEESHKPQKPKSAPLSRCWQAVSGHRQVPADAATAVASEGPGGMVVQRGSTVVVKTRFRRKQIAPNALALALASKSIDCVQLILNAVLQGKVTRGSYLALSEALSDMAHLYPDMCEAFLLRLPFQFLGEVEVPSHLARGHLLRAENCTTAYKEIWRDVIAAKVDKEKQTFRTAHGVYNYLRRLKDRVTDTRRRPLPLYFKSLMSRNQSKPRQQVPTVTMSAVAVQLPFATSATNQGLLHVLIGSKVGVETYGSDTVRAVIKYKWSKYAGWRVLLFAVQYLTFLALFTVYAVLVSQDPGPPQYCSSVTVTSDCSDLLGGCETTCSAATCAADGPGSFRGASYSDLLDSPRGRAEVVLSFIVMAYAMLFLIVDLWQLWQLGPLAYIYNFWNWMDVTSYTLALIIPPMVLAREGMGDQGVVYNLVAAEVLIVWIKSFFYGLAVDRLGTFIYMIIEIIKGLKYFYLMVIICYVAFAVALINLFRRSPSGDTCACTYPGYASFGEALLSLYQSMFQNQPPILALRSPNATGSIIVLCLATFLCNILLINLIITLMGDLFDNIKTVQDVVFQKNRADLTVEVDSILYPKGRPKRDGYKDAEAPYLMLLLPITQEERYRGLNAQWGYDRSPPPFMQTLGPGGGPGRGPGGGYGARSMAGMPRGSFANREYNHPLYPSEASPSLPFPPRLRASGSLPASTLRQQAPGLWEGPLHTRSLPTVAAAPLQRTASSATSASSSKNIALRAPGATREGSMTSDQTTAAASTAASGSTSSTVFSSFASTRGQGGDSDRGSDRLAMAAAAAIAAIPEQEAFLADPPSPGHLSRLRSVNRSKLRSYRIPTATAASASALNTAARAVQRWRDVIQEGQRQRQHSSSLVTSIPGQEVVATIPEDEAEPPGSS